VLAMRGDTTSAMVEGAKVLLFLVWVALDCTGPLLDTSVDPYDTQYMIGCCLSVAIETHHMCCRFASMPCTSSAF
jgi:hypothetical protein